MLFGRALSEKGVGAEDSAVEESAARALELVDERPLHYSKYKQTHSHNIVETTIKTNKPASLSVFV